MSNKSPDSSHDGLPPPPTQPTAPPSAPSAPSASSSLYPSDSLMHDPYPQQQYAESSLSIPVAQTFDDSPPSYEAVIIKDIPQLHDNYDHLRGPIGQRGQDLKTRIPAESLSSSYYQSAGNGSSSGIGDIVGSGSSTSEANYGATTTSSAEPGAITYHGIIHSPTSAQAPNLRLQGQIALDDDSEYAQDVDRLLGAEEQEHTDDELGSQSDDLADNSSWAIVGDERVWMALCYMLFLLLPWTFFCYAWTLAVMLLSFFTLIIPPLGYIVTIASVASWRALARVDLVLSAALVSDEILQRYPHIKAKVYIAAEPGPAWTTPRLFGYELPLPEFIRRKLQSRHAARGRRAKNLWHRGAKHFGTTTRDRHTISSMFYFLVWKMMFAIPIFVVVLVYLCLTVPFMICLLPSLLAISRAFANWQYRWAVTWLSEKPAPIVL
ncbi:hypothetical protein BGX28_004841 [Mortierella sp. GBA30]|nr:hypothetical protein BGX28_004841 [Mortierella sp. GBA30]